MWRHKEMATFSFSAKWKWRFSDLSPNKETNKNQAVKKCIRVESSFNRKGHWLPEKSGHKTWFSKDYKIEKHVTSRKTSGELRSSQWGQLQFYIPYMKEQKLVESSIDKRQTVSTSMDTFSKLKRGNKKVIWIVFNALQSSTNKLIPFLQN